MPKYEETPFFQHMRSLPEDEKEEFYRNLKRKREEKPRKDFKIESLTNADLAEMDEFKNYCKKINIEASKRQASKHRDEFIKWYYETH